MHIVDIAVNDGIIVALGEKLLQPVLYCLVTENLLVRFTRHRRHHRTPQSAAVFAGHLEQIAPLIRIGKIATVAGAPLLLEIDRSGQDQEPFREGVSFEVDVERLSYSRTATISTDKVIARDDFLPAIRSIVTLTPSAV